jgi:predicted RNA-binding protein with RPS1 domain
VLRVGQEVDVYVLGINAQEKKIALSIKRTQAEPWSRVATAYEVGQLVRGTVTQLANFGAFARIEDGIEGLIHVSELVDDRVTHPKQVVSEGDELLLRIIRIDPQRRRMGLSLRRALDTPDSELAGVFGPEVLQERDELIERIRGRLEAEGIELGDAFTAGAQEPIEAEAAATSEASAPVAAAEVAPTESPTVEPAAAPEAPARPAPQPKARKESPRPAVELPDDLDGELSAMAMAFAMAGAPADLVAGRLATPKAKRLPTKRGSPPSEPGAGSVRRAPRLHGSICGRPRWPAACYWRRNK